MNMEINLGNIEYGTKILCSGVVFQIQSGDCILLCGANGSGKSSMLRKLTSLYPQATLIPTGIPKVKGFTLEEFILTSCYSESNWRSRISPEQRKRIDEAIGLLDLDGKDGEDLRHRDISTLSDGEFQKACIAAALSRDSEIILMDEPTAFLDTENKIMVMKAMKDAARSTGKIIIFSSHDIESAARTCTAVLAIGNDHTLHISRDSDKFQEVISAIFKNKNLIFEG